MKDRSRKSKLPEEINLYASLISFRFRPIFLFTIADSNVQYFSIFSYRILFIVISRSLFNIYVTEMCKHIALLSGFALVFRLSAAIYVVYRCIFSFGDLPK